MNIRDFETKVAKSIKEHEKDELIERVMNISMKLEDKVSQEIYINRMLYFLTKQSKYLIKMVLASVVETDKFEYLTMKELLLFLKEKLEMNNDYSVSVFGAGKHSNVLVHDLVRLNLNVKCVYDRNKELHGKYIEGVKIVSTDELKVDENNLIIISSAIYGCEIYEELINRGCFKDNIFRPTTAFTDEFGVQYFGERFIESGENEIFVDGGACDGLTSVWFSKWCEKKYSQIYIFEPDKRGAQACEINMITSLERATLVKAGLWERTGKLKFCSDVLGNSHFEEFTEGEDLVDVISLDEFLEGKPVTFIKLDIEGTELYALKGARKTIEKYKPRLSICLYHKPEDLITIPEYILSLRSDYKLYVRHYSFYRAETVLYAI